MLRQDDHRLIYKLCLTRDELKGLSREIAEDLKKEFSRNEKEILTFDETREYLKCGKTKLRMVIDSGKANKIEKRNRYAHNDKNARNTKLSRQHKNDILRPRNQHLLMAK